MKRKILYTSLLFLAISCENSNSSELDQKVEANDLNINSVIEMNENMTIAEQNINIFDELKKLQNETNEKILNVNNQDQVIHDFILNCDSLNSLINYRDYILNEYKDNFEWEINHNIENYTDDFKEFFILETDEGEVWSNINPDFIAKTINSKSLTKENKTFVKQYVKELKTDMFVEVYLILKADELFSNAESWGEIMNYSKGKEYRKTVESYYNLYMRNILSSDNYLHENLLDENLGIYRQDYLDLINKCIKENPKNHITKDFKEFKLLLENNEFKNSDELELFTNERFNY